MFEFCSWQFLGDEGTFFVFLYFLFVSLFSLSIASLHIKIMCWGCWGYMFFVFYFRYNYFGLVRGQLNSSRARALPKTIVHVDTEVLLLFGKFDLDQQKCFILVDSHFASFTALPTATVDCRNFWTLYAILNIDNMILLEKKHFLKFQLLCLSC